MRRRVRALANTEPWNDGRRRAAVNAFGFGGINAHVIVDSPNTGGRSPSTARSARANAVSVLVLAAATQAALRDALQSGRTGGDGPWRLAVFEPTAKKIAIAMAAIEAGQARHGRDGIHFSPGGLLHHGGKVAFLFPGLEANFAPQVVDIAESFGMPTPNVDAADLEHQGFHVFTLNSFLDRVTAKVGLRPDMIAGHSIGEWSGMVASGIFEGASLDDFLAALEPGNLARVAEVSYVAVGTGAHRLAALIADLDDVVVSHDNCMHQSIACGPRGSIEALALRLRDQRILHEILPFRSGFHSPALAGHLDFYAERLARLKLEAVAIPLWSATTCAPYPSDPSLIRALFLDHLIKPVRFRELVLALHDAGARVFVQVGTGSLAAFVDDVLVDKPHYAVSLIAPHRPGMEQLRRACAALYVEGADIDMARLDPSETMPSLPSRDAMTLELGAPLIRLDALRMQSTSQRAVVEPVHGDPVIAAFEAGMRELAAVQEEVLRAFTLPRQVATASLQPNVTQASERTDHVELSLAASPS